MIAQIEQITGINNVASDLRIQKYTMGQGIVMLSGDLKRCINFRCRDDGFAEVRNGMIKKYSGNAPGVLFTNKAKNLSLFVNGTTLYRLNEDYTVTSLYASLRSSLDMAFTEHDDKVFMGNGAQMLRYKDGVVSTWQDITQSTPEFETPVRVYGGLPLSDIIHSYRARVYIAWDRFVFGSEELLPEKYRKATVLTVDAPVTAISSGESVLYVHTLNKTYPFVGIDFTDFQQMEPINIGAIKHFPGIPVPLKNPIWMSRRGWSTAEGPQVDYIDHEHFRLDLPNTARCYTGYDLVNKEVLCQIKT